jgi:hypothetical protein
MGIAFLGFVTMVYFPKDGIRINDQLTLHFASLDDFNNTEEGGIDDVEAFLNQYEVSIDSTEILDSIQKANIIFRKEMLRIQWPNGDRRKMMELLSSLDQVKSGSKKKVRVMHYGDSQIEGDRITSYIRDQFQKEYGGEGPGLIPIVEGVPSAVINQVNSENWYRFTLFGRRDTNILNYRYAPMGSMGMFSYPVIDSLQEDSIVVHSSIAFSQSGMAKKRAKNYSELTLYYGFASSETNINTFIEDSLRRFDELVLSDNFQTLKWEFPSTPKHLRLEFEGRKSPEFYAFSFESKRGVIVDNIPMRGSSGTLFKKMDRRQLANFIQNQNVELFILQYGGNTVPYIKSKLQAVKYGGWFKSQLDYLKSLKPNATFIVIGPSDMATKVAGTFMTYPHLEDVRDALKKAAFDSGAGFWDLYEVMGGKNSMISWVESTPPLAGSDYVHFNHRGTKRVSELFIQALWSDFDELEKEKIELENIKVMEVDTIKVDTLPKEGL